MTEESLTYINELMKSIDVPYELGMWKSKIKNPYFVGEYSEPEYDIESGLQESSFIITGTFKDLTLLEVERFKKIIKNACVVQTGLPNGNGLVINYAGCIDIPTGDERIKRIQINLNIKEWEV